MSIGFNDVMGGLWAAGSTLLGAANIAMNKNHPHRQMEFTDSNRRDIHEQAIRNSDTVLGSVNHFLNQKGVVLHDEAHQAIRGLASARNVEELADGHEKVANAFGSVFQAHRQEKNNEYNLAGFGLHHTAATGLRALHHGMWLTTEGHGFE